MKPLQVALLTRFRDQPAVGKAIMRLCKTCRGSVRILHLRVLSCKFGAGQETELCFPPSCQSAVSMKEATVTGNMCICFTVSKKCTTVRPAVTVLEKAFSGCGSSNYSIKQ